jgi:hypothetical protein
MDRILRSEIRQAQMTPTAASMKDHKFAGHDSQVCSLARAARTRVFMRRPVVRQMKKPIVKTTARPIFLGVVIWRREITGMGRAKIRRSVERLKAVHVQLVIMLEAGCREG